MSKYTGKCDFYDVIKIWGEDIILNCRIMIRKDTVLEVKGIEDLKPYFAHIIASMGIGKEKNEDGYYGTIFLSNKTYTEEYKDSLRSIYNEKEWLDRCRQIDECYDKFQEELWSPYYAVSYMDDKDITHIVPFKEKTDAEKFCDELKKGKRVYIICVDGKQIKYV